MKRITIIFIVLTICLCGCKTARHIPVTTEIKTEIKEVIRDTVVYVPADRATVTALLECDSVGNVLIREIETLQGELNAKATIIIKENVVTANCQCDSTAIYLRLKDRYEETKIKEKIPVYVEKPLKWWQAAFMWAGIAALIVSIILITIKIK
jgi:hypothetical protein